MSLFEAKFLVADATLSLSDSSSRVAGHKILMLKPNHFVVHVMFPNGSMLLMGGVIR